MWVFQLVFVYELLLTFDSARNLDIISFSSRWGKNEYLDLNLSLLKALMLSIPQLMLFYMYCVKGRRVIISEFQSFWIWAPKQGEPWRVKFGSDFSHGPISTFLIVQYRPYMYILNIAK